MNTTVPFIENMLFKKFKTLITSLQVGWVGLLITDVCGTMLEYVWHVDCKKRAMAWESFTYNPLYRLYLLVYNGI